MRVVTCSALCLALVLAKAGFGPAAPKTAAETTHHQTKEIAVKGDVSGHTLQTLCLDGEGNVVALVAPGRHGAAGKTAASEVQVFKPDGQPVRKWKVDFLGQSINA